AAAAPPLRRKPVPTPLLRMIQRAELASLVIITQRLQETWISTGDANKDDELRVNAEFERCLWEIVARRRLYPPRESRPNSVGAGPGRSNGPVNKPAPCEKGRLLLLYAAPAIAYHTAATQPTTSTHLLT